MSARGSDGERWVVTSLGPSVASVEVDGDAIEKVPRWLIPVDAHEGDVLAVERSRGPDRVSIVVKTDPAATREALAASEKQMRDAPVDKKGGDVKL
ncbi:DUF3006 family protein [Gemmatirosa kalamazoonensis]|uniref:DUF3006 family protein n=1 Tax=Gemmatirosa kalamazoonensis TaxID=861299 RepID=UPI00046CDB23|nr:DUF3006 family protein [Gemmatirosa kalamazoonensis]